MKIIVIIIFVGLLSCISSCSVIYNFFDVPNKKKEDIYKLNNQENEYFEKGLELYNKKKYKKARDYFLKIVNLQSDISKRAYEKFLISQAMLLKAEKDYCGAKQLFKTVLIYNPECEECKKHIKALSSIKKSKNLKYIKPKKYFKPKAEQKLPEKKQFKPKAEQKLPEKKKSKPKDEQKLPEKKKSNKTKNINWSLKDSPDQDISNKKISDQNISDLVKLHFVNALNAFERKKDTIFKKEMITSISYKKKCHNCKSYAVIYNEVRPDRPINLLYSNAIKNMRSGLKNLYEAIRDIALIKIIAPGYKKSSYYFKDGLKLMKGFKNLNPDNTGMQYVKKTDQLKKDLIEIQACSLK